MIHFWAICVVWSVKSSILRALEAKLVAIMDREKDSLRIYNLGNHYAEKITHYGVKPGYDPGGTLMV